MGGPNAAWHNPPLRADETLYRWHEMRHCDRLSRRSINHPRTSSTIEDIMEKLKVQTRLSVLTIAIGLVLMIYKIYADSEPGLIPILLVVLGSGWYFITRARIRSHHKQLR